ncbi:DNA-directed RNA polymerase subunit alpha [Candidatus Aerophobetes bacterium]|uniref:DNA-directed RNA polymerase subunit alpha n=1 Tax=Aerophobetes bacterium TaxID=2030807 RepID=A0A523S1P2_UNCAE|nr:MAG: DNA-directed RNA polymerase subunit alpha [Candidatus Aerophobetes bacterium]
MLKMHKPNVKVKLKDDFHGEFIIEPLERGFGHTLGNSIRRVLLSSIEGVGITQIMMDNTMHEFSTVEGMREDIIEFTANLKDIVFKLEGDDPVILKLDKKGPGEVTASDISLPAEVEVVNPDSYICTLAKKGNIKVEIKVEKDKGYRTAEENTIEGEPLGVIPLDTIFSPVKLVSFKVENTRVGQMTNFDKLSVDIDTNGSIKPEDALSQASKIINDYMALLIDLSDKTQKDMPIFEEIEEEDDKQEYPSIEELELSVRVYNCLKREGVDTVEKLLEYTEDELLDIRNFGQKSIQEVKDKIKELELFFKKK